MTTRDARIFASLVGALGSACSFGSFQTAHTQAPATVSATGGVTEVFNKNDGTEGRDLVTNFGGQLGVRVGLADRVDVGLGTFFQDGARADAKVNVLSPKASLAVAPRIGAGYRHTDDVWMAEAGVITSYRLPGGIEPYLGLSFANHWIGDYQTSDPIPPNAVGRSGTGDGLLQLSLGAELAAWRHVAVLAEYGHWFVLNDDPGDHYHFVPVNILGLALRVGRI